MSNELLLDKNELKRKALLVQCESKEALQRWIRVYLDIDLPDITVDPSSNSSPMDLVWEVYSKMSSGDPDFTRVLFYAARDSFKTLASSIIELLAVLHFKRDTACLAAIESQSKVNARYVQNYSNLPYIKDYVTKLSERRIEFTRYTHRNTGEVISPVEFSLLPAPEREEYKELTNFVAIVIATLKGSNSLHCQMLVLDELDLAPRGPIEEAKMIPTDCRDGKPPMVLMTSSRKYSYGLVQEAIDSAAETGLHVRHWNLIDVSRKCPPERHLPNEPMVDIYYSSQSLKRCSKEEYDLMNEEQKKTYEVKKGYSGCLKNCRFFAACQGRLATRPDSKSRMLKTLAHVQGLFRQVEVEVAKAQLMCWKPSSFGLIYPNFDPSIHMKTAGEMYTKITGEPAPANFNKQSLMQFAKDRGLQFYSGMDHGYTHDFAVVTGIKDMNNFFVIDVISAPELELAQKIEVCNRRLGGLETTVYADPEDPASNKTIGRFFKMREWSKGPGTVVGGINIVRYKLLPTMGTPQLFFLKDDEGCERLSKDFLKYHWDQDANGKPTDQPAEDIEVINGKVQGDDRLDALRYVVMNVFPPKGRNGISIGSAKIDQPPPQQKTQQNWAQQVILEHIGQSADPVSAPIIRGRKGKLSWSIG